jgi:uncharacterized tellurite resistance protein B-like protein
VNLWRILGVDPSDPPARARFGGLFDAVSRLLADRPDEEIKRIAGLAGLLGVVAHADDAMTAQELERIRGILRERLRLTDVEIDPIATLLRDHRVQLFALESHIYARLINEAVPREQKHDLLRALFHVAAVDHSINVEEDRALWMLADALLLSHREFVTVRAEFSADRDVLRD